jgi:ubiquinone/menaquinone biosynthesis C-methylase UbiE
MINWIIKSIKRYDWFKRLNAKVTYELLAKYVPAKEWQFMNYGYNPTANDPPLVLGEDKKMQRYSTQMYHYLAIKTTIEGKEILEVGSGRGGGAFYIAKNLNPKKYIGMDLAQNAVDLANKTHVLPNLSYIQGSAESIPLSDNSVDVVINVESCHAYGDVPKFLSEVKRTLRPGGYFLMVDFRNTQENMAILKKELRESQMELLTEEDISPNVVQAIEAEDQAKRAQIEAFVPKKWQKLFSEFAGVAGSPFHLTLKEGTRSYGRFIMRKMV